MRIERIAQPIDAPFPQKIDMSDLTERMNSGVSSPGPVNHAACAIDGEDRLLQTLLHGDAIGLSLPANKWRAVIFDCQSIAGHRQTTSASPCASLQPRKNSSADISALPARCTRNSRNAPSPQAISPSSSSAAPGAPPAP